MITNSLRNYSNYLPSGETPIAFSSSSSSDRTGSGSLCSSNGGTWGGTGGGTTGAGSGGCLAAVCVECDVPFTGAVAFSSTRRPRERREAPCDESVELLGIPLLRDPLRRTPLEPTTRGNEIWSTFYTTNCK